MNKRMAFLLFSASFAMALSVSAQLKSPQENAFQNDIENVLIDYPNGFQHYIGNEIVNNPQSTDYTALLKIRGAEECTITKFPSKKRDRYSYQAVLLTTDDFENAKSVFSNFYSRLNNLNFRLAKNAYSLTGQYEQPAEEKKFTSTVFSVSPTEEGVQRMKVELLLEYSLLEWKVKLLIYEKEREDNERGVTVE